MRKARDRLMVLSLVLTVLGAMPASPDETTGKQYVFQVSIYQVFTNITGNGLISQTLPGVSGWLQIIHEKLDDVELVMDGDTITWNGKSAPDYARIVPLTTPTVSTPEGQRATIVTKTSGPAQYMTRKEGNLFELRTVAGEQDTEPGIVMLLLPSPSDRAGHINCDLQFSYTWIKDRKKIEGVSLPIGEPIMSGSETNGNVMMELGKWSCLTMSTDSQGHLYVFIKCTPA